MSQKDVVIRNNNSYCCVPQCKTSGTEPGISFHQFPSSSTDVLRRKRWILAFRIGKPVSKRMKACSKHFKKSDYFPPLATGYKRPRLKNNVVPSLNLPVSDLHEEIRNNQEESISNKMGEQVSDKNEEPKKITVLLLVAERNSGYKFVPRNMTQQ